uniref:Cytochrome P450 n=1 Tax=Chromera velia CCMP2878 TaxID=1169474 RepID=A0A0G4GN61_9ALVE|eukprot:Cvel_4947.t1-p1 / transcript=Cvel_4947.t1 / gene=Cvel_4947 / organism=Chromera_velia_CCMP2878 / gene_product=Cytochrome P450 714C2, putative / transcript_product=Cytochrome P450 714C2, putative / location=Cvel_scaffold223:101742-109148(-) / protein_length=676 / sequence_SO=supercontig / SO=protein_coding / is_pseudo=false
MGSITCVLPVSVSGLLVVLCLCWSNAAFAFLQSWQTHNLLRGELSEVGKLKVLRRRRSPHRAHRRSNGGGEVANPTLRGLSELPHASSLLGIRLPPFLGLAVSRLCAWFFGGLEQWTFTFRRRFGGVCLVELGRGSPVVWLSDPELVKELTSLRSVERPERGLGPRALTEEGLGLLFSRGPRWEELRKGVMPSFQRIDFLNFFCRIFSEETLALVDCWRERARRESGGVTVRLEPVLQQLTLQTVARCVFDLSLNLGFSPGSDGTTGASLGVRPHASEVERNRFLALPTLLRAYLRSISELQTPEWMEGGVLKWLWHKMAFLRREEGGRGGRREEERNLLEEQEKDRKVNRALAPLWDLYVDILRRRRRRLSAQFLSNESLMRALSGNLGKGGGGNGVVGVGLTRPWPPVLLDLLLQAGSDPSECTPRLSERELAAVVHDILLAGSDTTATLVCACIFFIFKAFVSKGHTRMSGEGDASTSSSTSTLLERLRKERRSLRESPSNLGNTDSSSTATIPTRSLSLSYEDTQSLPLLFACVQETLRLAPPIGLVARQVKSETTLGHTQLPANTTICFSPFPLQRDPVEWGSRAGEFDPSRFLPEEIQENARHSHSFLPFGAGARACIGARFAEVQAMVILSILLENFDFSFVERTLPAHYAVNLNFGKRQLPVEVSEIR